MAEGVMKCPSCGAPIESFQTRCALCGYELKGQEVSSTVKTFVAQISRFDDAIFNSSEVSGVSQKKISVIIWILLWLFGIAPFVLLYRYIERVTGKKFVAKLIFAALFVIYAGIICINSGESQKGILLIVTAALGVIAVYLLIALFAKPILSANEKKKSEYIINFPIPNSREDILEFTSICVTRYKKLSVFKSLFTAEGKKQKYWNNVWQDKAKQLNVKASIAMAGDPSSLQTVQTLLSNAGMTN